MNYFTRCPDNANCLVKTNSGAKLINKTGNMRSGHQVRVRVVHVAISDAQRVMMGIKFVTGRYTDFVCPGMI